MLKNNVGQRLLAVSRGGMHQTLVPVVIDGHRPAPLNQCPIRQASGYRALNAESAARLMSGGADHIRSIWMALAAATPVFRMDSFREATCSGLSMRMNRATRSLISSDIRFLRGLSPGPHHRQHD